MVKNDTVLPHKACQSFSVVCCVTPCFFLVLILSYKCQKNEKFK